MSSLDLSFWKYCASIVVGFLFVKLIFDFAKKKIGYEDFSKDENSRLLSMVRTLSAAFIAAGVWPLLMLFFRFISGKFLLDFSQDFETAIGAIVAIIAAIVVSTLFRREAEEKAAIIQKKIDNQYAKVGKDAVDYLGKLFDLRDSVEETYIMHMIVNDYRDLSQHSFVLVSFDTYLKVVMKFLREGYHLVSVNKTLLPFWYAPVSSNNSTEEYMSFFNRELSFKEKKRGITYERITYYSTEEWENDTVRMIFDDLTNGEGGREYALKWLATLIKKIGYSVQDIDLSESLSLTIHGINNYLRTTDKGINDKFKEEGNDKNWSILKAKLTGEFSGQKINHFKEINNLVKEKYCQSFGEEGVKSCSSSIFYDTFRDWVGDMPTEIGYFTKGTNKFALVVVGEVSQALKLQIVTQADKLEQLHCRIQGLKIKR